jgi:hypothetical protein
MPRKRLKRWLPKRGDLTQHPALRLFGGRLADQNLWHLNRRSVAGGVAIGAFCAFLPVPFQMLFAGMAAIVFRANLPISVVAVWISNPLTWLPLYGSAYLLGAALLDKPQVPLDTITMAWLWQRLGTLWVGCLLLGTIAAVAGYFMSSLLWRSYVLSNFRARRKRRQRQRPR